MKRAPNLKHQPKDKMTEVIIFAGSDAWAHAKEWSEWAGKHIAADDTHPVILGPEQLASLADTQIIDKGRYYVRVYRAGEISVLAFGRQADALAKHQKGELVSVAGNMQISQWTDQNGEMRQGWQVIADSVISARTVRPGGRKGQQGQATDALNRTKQQTGQQDDPYEDEIPF